MDMHPRIVAFFRVLITLVAIAGIGLFIYGWFTHSRDTPPVLSLIILAILANTLGIKFPQIDALTKTPPKQDSTLTVEDKNDKHE